MFSMTKLALAAALVLGAASAVQANDNDRNDAGGFRVGPMGQEFPGANPAYHPSMRHEHKLYAYVPDNRIPSRHQTRGWSWGWDRY
jgi:hypothetical protein